MVRVTTREGLRLRPITRVTVIANRAIEQAKPPIPDDRRRYSLEQLATVQNEPSRKVSSNTSYRKQRYRQIIDNRGYSLPER